MLDPAIAQEAKDIARGMLQEEPDPEVVRVITQTVSAIPAQEVAQMITAGHWAQRMYWAKEMSQPPSGLQAILHG